MVAPAGIEPASSESESEILSIVLRGQFTNQFTSPSESLPDCVTQAGESEILSIVLRGQKMEMRCKGKRNERVKKSFHHSHHFNLNQKMGINQ